MHVSKNIKRVNWAQIGLEIHTEVRLLRISLSQKFELNIVILCGCVIYINNLEYNKILPR